MVMILVRGELILTAVNDIAIIMVKVHSHVYIPTYVCTDLHTHSQVTTKMIFRLMGHQIF